MPLIVKDYIWEETPSTVGICIPLKGVKKDKVDIFSTEDYIKVSFPPHLFEIILFQPIDEDSSTALIENGMVVFKLLKLETVVWGQLCSNIMEDKAALRAKKEEILLNAQKKAEERANQKQEQKRQNEKHALRKAMDLDAEERERIESIKEAEKKKATEELEKWKEEQRQQALKEKAELEEVARKEREIQEAELRKQKLLEKAKKRENIFEANNQTNHVRNAGTIEVTFTPRVFPTALRESTKPLEDEWLKKQAEARQVAEIEDSDLTEEERNPVFMKEKADKFFKDENYHAAINAYTHAIRLSKGKMPSLYSNRAACHLKLRNLMKSIEDSSKALELLTPAVSQNAVSRCKAHVRRGTAFCELELYVEGLHDYQAALKIFPDDEQLKADEERIRKIIESSQGCIS